MVTYDTATVDQTTLCSLLQQLHDLLDEALPDNLHSLVLLEHLPGYVEEQILGVRLVHHTLDKAQVT